MSTEKIELKSYKVLKQLGWNKGVYAEGDMVEMEPRFAEYYVNEKVLEEAEQESPTSNETAIAPAFAPLPKPDAALSLTTETEES